MILGIVGQKNSGKDSIAAYLIKEHGFERRAFADPLKKSVAALFDIPYHEIDKWKNDREVRVAVHQVGITGDGTKVTGISNLSFRELLQRYGTEAHRDVFGQDFWLDHTLPTDGYYAGKKIAVTDVRFSNEVKRIRDCGGYVVKVLRPGLKSNDQHSSELELTTVGADYEIVNDASIQMLYESVERMLYTIAEEAYTAKQVIGGQP